MRFVLLVVSCLASLSLAQTQPDTLTPPPPPPQQDVELQQLPPIPPSTPTSGYVPQPLNRKRDTGRYKYDPAYGVPPGYQLISEPRWALVAVGAAMFAGATAWTVVLGSSMNEPIHIVPIVGPIVSTVNAWNWAGTNSGRGVAAFFYTWLTIVEIGLQAAGIACLVAGFTAQTQYLERERPPRVTLVPVLGPGFAGASLAARF
ncbi:MAG: hypothetical protein QM817_30630 [Archangium sp.]